MQKILFTKYINKKIQECNGNNESSFYLRIKVLPKSSKDKVVDIMDDETIKIRIKAVPEKGKANKELTKFLRKELSRILLDHSNCVQYPSTAKCDIEIISGKTDQVKLIKIIL